MTVMNLNLINIHPPALVMETNATKVWIYNRTVFLTPFVVGLLSCFILFASPQLSGKRMILSNCLGIVLESLANRGQFYTRVHLFTNHIDLFRVVLSLVCPVRQNLRGTCLENVEAYEGKCLLDVLNACIYV